MTREELSLLTYLETCAVDHGGLVDSRKMNKEDFTIVEKWNKSGYLLFGRVYSKDIITRSNWVNLSSIAWHDAHAEREARFKRMNEKRTWRKTEETRMKISKEAEQLTTAEVCN